MLDVAIVGGGPAGLSAALVLGRCDRRVVVLDSGRYRNAPSRALHGFLTRDGVSPERLRQVARQQLQQRYPRVEVLKAEATRIRRVRAGFVLDLADGRTVEARRVLLASGVVDNLPPLPGLAQLFGRRVFLCPYCDGWEVRGTPLGVHGRRGTELALALTTWTDDVVLFADGRVEPTDARRLRDAGVQVERAAVTRLRGARGGVELHLASGSVRHRRAVFLALERGQRARSTLAEQLGARFKAGRLVVGRRGATSVAGVFAAGDITDGVALSIIAAAEGATAACGINAELAAEDRGGRGR